MKKLLYVITGIVFGGAALAFLLALIFEDKVKDIAVRQLNNNLTAEVHINGNDIEFSLLRHFPSASLQFSNFTIKSKDKTDTAYIARVKNASLLFNSWDIITGKYNIAKIIVKDADLNLRINKNGVPNFEIWKNDGAEKAQKGMAMRLHNITLLRVHIRYYDEGQKLLIDETMREALIAGHFYDQKFTLEMNAAADLHKFSIENIPYLQNNNILLKTEMAVDGKASRYTIKSCDATINNAGFTVDGYAQTNPDNTELNFNIKGKENNIQTLVALLPQQYAGLFSQFESQGKMHFEGFIKGKISATHNPLVQVNFGINNGTVKDKTKPLALQQVNMSGFFTNGSKRNLYTSQLSLKNLSCVLNGRKFTADVQVNNLYDPYMQCAVNGSVNLTDVKHFMEVPYIADMSGDVVMNMKFSGKVNDLNDPALRYKAKIEGTVAFKNTSVTGKEIPLSCSNMNGNLAFDGSNLLIEQFSGKMKRTNFKVYGQLNNVAAFVFLPDQQLTGRTSFYADQVYMEDFITEQKPGTKNSKPAQFTFPTFLLCDADIKVDALHYNKMHAYNLKGNVSIHETGARFKGISVNTMDGRITASGILNVLPGNRFSMRFNSSTYHVDVSKLLYSMDNFGQDQLTHKNLKGYVSSKGEYYAIINSDLSPDLNSVTATVNVAMEDGRLTNFAPLVKMGKFIKLNNLSDMSFNKITNTIAVKNKVIIIPKMDIESSAMNMSLAGTHTFDNQMDYRVMVNASQLLFGKRGDSYDDGFGTVQVKNKGAVKVFLKVTGSGDDPKISYDTDGAVKNLQSGLQKEKEELQRIFNGKGPEGSNKNDLNKPTKDYELKWDDDEDVPVKNTNNSSTKKQAEKQPDLNDKINDAWKNFKKQVSE